MIFIAKMPRQALTAARRERYAGHELLTDERNLETDMIDARTQTVTKLESTIHVASADGVPMRRGKPMDRSMLGPCRCRNVGDLAIGIAPGPWLKGMGGGLLRMASAQPALAGMRPKTEVAFDTAPALARD